MGDAPYPHLKPEAAAQMHLPCAARIAECRTDKWIPYPRAVQAMALLDGIFAHPKAQRMVSVLLVGRAGNGKSSILDRFHRQHPVVVGSDGRPERTIVFISMPESPDESQLWSQILWALGISHRDREPAHTKRRQAREAMLYANTAMLVIDEFQHVSNRAKAGTNLLAALKGLSNDLKIPIVAAGTEAAINALNTDDQMKTRFVPFELPRWSLNLEYRRFLASYERVLPLKHPSDLSRAALSRKIFSKAGFAIGETVRLLRDAAEHAITQAATAGPDAPECITEQVVDSLGWKTHEDWKELAKRL